jgi:hypothetical protein
MEAIKVNIDQLMREDEEFQDYSINNILLLLSKAMNFSYLSVYKEQIITYIQDKKRKIEYQVVIQTISTNHQL